MNNRTQFFAALRHSPKLCREILYREAKEILTNMEVDDE